MRRRIRPLSRYQHSPDRDFFAPPPPSLWRCPACGAGTPADARMCATCGYTFNPRNRAYRRALGPAIPAGRTFLPRFEYRRVKGRWEIRERRWGTIRGRKGHRHPR